MAEPDAVHRLALVFEFEGQVFLTHQPLRDHFDLFAERWCRKTLAPDLFVQHVHQLDSAVLGFERSIGIKATGECGSVQPLLRYFVQALLEVVKIFLCDGAARRHGVAAKAQQHARVALGHQIQRVAQVEAWDGAARAFELVLLARRGAGRKHKRGAVQFVLDARGHDADHAFMKVGVEHTNGGRRFFVFVKQRFSDGKGLLAHAAFNLAALAVDAVQHLGQFVTARDVVGQQALNAQRHVGQAAGRVDARP